MLQLYCDYVACLNRSDRDDLAHYVNERVEYNGRPLGLAGYREMLVGEYDAVPVFRFNIALVATEPPVVAARLAFQGYFGSIDAGPTVTFAEHAFYEFRADRIATIRSLRDGSAAGPKAVAG